MGRPRVVRSVEEQKAVDELRRERNRQNQRRRRESRTDQEREAEAKRRRIIRQADAQQRRIDNAARMRRYHAARKDKEFTGSWLLKSSSAAEHASSITWASRLAGKSSSLSQCGVPAESKTSQADFKPKSRGVGVQTQQERRIPANSVHKKSAGTSAVHRSRPEAADVALRLWEELQSRQQATAPSLE
ncbi:uncharacterized protein LOC144145878 isoform X5 [Haemaphysalis longicornis]